MNRHLNGWKKDPKDKRDYPFQLKGRPRIPAVVNLQKYLSPVEDQGQAGSCVANAIVGATECLDAKDGGTFTDDSVLFAYWIARAIDGFQDEDNGAFIRSGIKAMARQGCCVEKLWPYDVSKVLTRPPQKCFTEARNHKFTSYMRLTKISDMLRCLAAGYPFAFGIQLFESFDGEEVARTGIVNMPEPNEQEVGGHAVLAVGYDQPDKRFLVRNSWGKDWGMGGYFTIPFEYIEKYGDDFWTIRR